MSETEVFHAGEIAVQARTGERAIAQRLGPMIADRLVDGARAFLGRQGVAAIGAAAPDGALWASLWCGAPGFLRADERGERVQVVSALDATHAADPVRRIVRTGEPLGIVVIDFATRRRFRVNGTTTRVDAMGLEVRVREAFGNCIKYIQRRERSGDQPNRPAAGATDGLALDEERRLFVARTDTLFVASIHPVRGLDVSHRGGHPGFVRVEDERTLRIPDYPGNSMFQTLGNLEVDRRAGLALVDFERRRVLSLTGQAVTAFGVEAPDHPTGGTGRYWSVGVERWVEFSLPPAIRWTLVERSPFNPSSSF
jgi:predicted pyridoxine 5'-phosphate oxidase superfamily flavin-nucleotide-binding protein